MARYICIMKFLVFIIGLLIASQTSATNAETLRLECRYVHTNSYSSPPEGDRIIRYFDLNMNRETAQTRTETGVEINLQTLFWNEDYIGLVSGGSDSFITGLTSYLFDRKNSRVVFSHLSPNDANLERRKGLHGIIKMTGALSNILMSCSSLGGF